MEQHFCGECASFGLSICGAITCETPACGSFRLDPRWVSTNDPVNPNHYKQHYAEEVIDLLQASLTPEEFKGYCKGNMLKYRFRAGYKGDRGEDLKKSNWYQDKLKEVSIPDIEDWLQVEADSTPLPSCVLTGSGIHHPKDTIKEVSDED